MKSKKEKRMIDLHTHTILSDGVLIPSELARRAEENGYKVIGITDHIDYSNVEMVVPAICKVCENINKSMKIKAIPGAEITHISPSEIFSMALFARELGAKLVVVHGETITEPVMVGTNREALKSEIDILAHPGLMTEEDAKMAADRGIYIEISGRIGHSFSNGHIVRLWYKYRFPIVLNTDTHSPENIINDLMAEKLILSAGIKPEDVREVLENSARLADRLL